MDIPIKIQIGDDVFILEGKQLEAYLEQQKKDNAEIATIEKERNLKIAARQSALAKLAELGLTEEEIAAL